MNPKFCLSREAWKMEFYSKRSGNTSQKQCGCGQKGGRPENPRGEKPM